MGDAAVFHPDLGGVAVQAGAGEAAVRFAVGADAAGGERAAAVGNVGADDGADIGGEIGQRGDVARLWRAACSADAAGRPVLPAIAKMRGMIRFR
jgi:hypothetical protein